MIFGKDSNNFLPYLTVEFSAPSVTIQAINCERVLKLEHPKVTSSSSEIDIAPMPISFQLSMTIRKVSKKSDLIGYFLSSIWRYLHCKQGRTIEADIGIQPFFRENRFNWSFRPQNRNNAFSKKRTKASSDDAAIFCSADEFSLSVESGFQRFNFLVGGFI
jgi:hypothetical protein